MRVLVLGGTRFLGREGVRALLDAGHAVTVLTRGNRPAPAGAATRTGDRSSPDDLARLAKDDWDVVWDNICYTGVDAEALTRAFSGRPVDLIMTSTMSVYELWPSARAPFGESLTDTPPEDRLPETRAVRLARGKLAAERLYMAAHEGGRLQMTILRLPVVLGPENPALHAYGYWRRLLDGGPVLLPEGGDTRWRFLSSAQFSRLICHLVAGSEGRGQVLNVAHEEVVSVTRFLRDSADALGTAAAVLTVPADVLRMHGLAPEEISPFSEPRDVVVDIGRMQAALTWRPGPWREELGRAAAWFRDHYQGPPSGNWHLRPTELELAARLRSAGSPS